MMPCSFRLTNTVRFYKRSAQNLFVGKNPLMFRIKQFTYSSHKLGKVSGIGSALLGGVILINPNKSIEFKCSIIVGAGTVGYTLPYSTPILALSAGCALTYFAIIGTGQFIAEFKK